MAFTIKINGVDRMVDVDGDTPLLWVLRDVLGMTGTKFGCGMALCGACTVHVDGAATRSCITPIDSIGSSEITTIEAIGATAAGAEILEERAGGAGDRMGRRAARQAQHERHRGRTRKGDPQFRGGCAEYRRYDAAMASAVTKVEATYEVPFLAHATMEPMNCTVHLRKDRCEVWVGSQVVARAQEAAAKTAGLPLDKVVVHNHLIGGGFGRRLEIDGVIRAVQIAQHVDGPVKVVWTREEDTQHDRYRPYFFDRMSGLDEKGMPVVWNHRFAGSSVMARWAPPFFNNGLDPDTTEGAINLVYALPNMHVEYLQVEPPGIPTAFWRSVGPSHNVFVTESFIDGLVAAAKQDPVEYRRALLDKAPRAKAVLELAAEKAGWGQPLPQRRVGRGVSVQFAFATYMAQVAEVEVSRDGTVRVQRVVCAVDCGTVVNPDTVQAQIQSAIIFGVTAALYGEITLKDGRVEQTNFDTYQVLRMNDEAPAIDVHIVQSLEPPGGMGEAGTSAIVPAVTNAIFAATGKRLRKMPIDTTTLKQPG
jgi:isoquinoline 1-oxidoreductase subunit beta